MTTITSFQSLTKSIANRCYRHSLIHSATRSVTLFGPSETDWKKWSKEFELQDIEEEQNKHRDPREITPQELRDSLKLRGKFAIDASIIPQLELPEKSWYSDSHIYIQQTNVDDVWRMGYSPLRFTGTRHVEWLVFDSEPKDIKLYSEALMWFSICDWRPLRVINQSINDIQFTMTSPFHRIQIISINEKIQSSPMCLIDDEMHPNWRWIITFRWINTKEEIFSKPPIDNGRYGRWFDSEQYTEWLKDEGEYKKWQMDQVLKMAEGHSLQRLGIDEDKSAKEQRQKEKLEQLLKSDDRPQYQKLDDEFRGVGDSDGTEEKTSWKPKWFPF